MSASMHKRFIGGVAALAIAVTAIGAGSAHAGSRITAEGAFVALLGLAIIGAIASDKRDDDKKVRNRKPKVSKKKATVVKPRPLPQRVTRTRELPRQCLRRLNRQNGGEVRILGQRCVERNYRFSQNLPQFCKRTLRTSNGLRHGWSMRCLRREGYQVAAR